MDAEVRIYVTNRQGQEYTFPHDTAHDGCLARRLLYFLLAGFDRVKVQHRDMLLHDIQASGKLLEGTLHDIAGRLL